MVVDQDIPNFFWWLLPHPGAEGGFSLGAAAWFLLITLSLILLFSFASFLVMMVRYGWIEAIHRISVTIGAVAVDIFNFSPTRVWAIARLAFREALRGRVLIGFGLFVLVMLFAGWFLDTSASNPGALYLGFVLTASTYMVLGLALFISVFSLPTDIQSRTIYTVVTKPVRPGELVLGRIIGFTGIGSMMLLMMAALSYVFVVRGLDHSHVLQAVEVSPDVDANTAEGPVLLVGDTSHNANHRHKAVIEPNGFGRTDVQMGQSHPVVAVYHLSGEWEWTFEDIRKRRLEAKGEISGPREQPNFAMTVEEATGGLQAQEGDSIAVSGGLLRGARLEAKIEGEPFDRDGDGELTLTAHRDWDAANPYEDFLRLKGVIVWPDGARTDVAARQISSPRPPAELLAFRVGSPEGALRARVPVYGKLTYLDRQGRATDKGINVGNEWTYRTHIEGGTLAAAIWQFNNVTPERFPGGLPLELNHRVFRTYKGDIEKQVMGSLVVRNPDTGLQSAPLVFESQEYTIQQIRIPRQLKATTADGREKDVDLFNDLVHRGRVQIILRCEERQQYFGVAQADLYLQSPDEPFFWNFIKGYISIWLQMVLITAFGVLFSTVLNSAIAMLATAGSYWMGYQRPFIESLAAPDPDTGRSVADGPIGGGPIESAVRIFTSKNMMVDLDLHWLLELFIKSADWLILRVLWMVVHVLPDYSNLLGTGEYVAHGYSIFGDLIAIQFATTMCYVLVIALFGYVLLKSREIAA